MTEEKIYNEMIRVCFSTSKKRKKFARVFKNWSQEERDDFLRGLGIYVRNARTIKVYFFKKYNVLKMLIKSEYVTRFKERVGFTTDERINHVYSQSISRREPLI